MHKLVVDPLVPAASSATTPIGMQSTLFGRLVASRAEARPCRPVRADKPSPEEAALPGSVLA